MTRETLKCKCGLNQFVNAAETCKRCKKTLRLPVAVPAELPEPEPVALIVRRSATEGLEITSAIAIEIKQRRKSAGLSQRGLAKRMGCPRTYISKLENDAAQPTIVSLMRITVALKVPAWQILKSAEEAMHKGE